jgi:hypothetical protein
MLATLLSLQAASPQGTVDWSKRLRDDAVAFRTAVLDSHPGPVNVDNPGFKPLLERAYARAQERAKSTSSFAHYAWALRELTAAFDDGHVGVGADFDLFRDHPWKYR